MFLLAALLVVVAVDGQSTLDANKTGALSDPPPRLHSGLLGKAGWLEARALLGPPLTYSDETTKATCNGKEAPVGNNSCSGFYQAYSKVNKTGQDFTSTTVAVVKCVGEWNQEVVIRDNGFLIFSSCKGAFRDTMTFFVENSSGANATVVDYQCALDFKYSSEGVLLLNEEQYSFNETVDCKFSENTRKLTSDKSLSDTREDLEASLTQLVEALGPQPLEADKDTEVAPVDGDCQVITTCNGFPAAAFQDCDGDFELQIICSNSDFDETCEGGWKPFTKGAMCRGTWRINYMSFAGASSHVDNVACEGTTTLAYEHIVIRGLNFSGWAEWCLGKSEYQEEDTEPVPGPGPSPAPGPESSAEWVASVLEQEVIESLEEDDIGSAI